MASLPPLHQSCQSRRWKAPHAVAGSGQSTRSKTEPYRRLVSASRSETRRRSSILLAKRNPADRENWRGFGTGAVIEGLRRVDFDIGPNRLSN